MKDAKRRTFENFRNTVGDNVIKNIALEYATENDFLDIVELSEKYNTSKAIIKKSLAYAVTHCLVSFNTCISMKNKAHRNQLKHCKNNHALTPSDSYYMNLLDERFSFVKSFDDKKTTTIVHYYLDNPFLSIDEISESLGLSPKEVNVLLKKAIILNIIDQEMVDKLVNLALQKSPNTPQLKSAFEKIIKNRDHYSDLTSKIANLYFDYDYYQNTANKDNNYNYEKCREINEKLEALEKIAEKFENSI